MHFCVFVIYPGIILGMGSANGRWCYNVTSPLIGWSHNQNDPCYPYLARLLYCRQGNHTIVPVPLVSSCGIWVKSIDVLAIIFNSSYSRCSERESIFHTLFLYITNIPWHPKNTDQTSRHKTASKSYKSIYKRILFCSCLTKISFLTVIITSDQMQFHVK